MQKLIGPFWTRQQAVDAARELKSQWTNVRVTGKQHTERGEGYFVKVGKRRANPSKRETKAERLMRLQRASRKRGLAAAAGTLMKKLNPSSKVHAVRVKRLKGGGVSLIPVNVNPGRRGGSYYKD